MKIHQIVERLDFYVNKLQFTLFMRHKKSLHVKIEKFKHDIQTDLNSSLNLFEYSVNMLSLFEWILNRKCEFLNTSQKDRIEAGRE